MKTYKNSAGKEILIVYVITEIHSKEVTLVTREENVANEYAEKNNGVGDLIYKVQAFEV